MRSEKKFRIVRAKKHQPGHPQFTEREVYDRNRHEFVIRREGCCDHVTGIVYSHGEMPKTILKRGKGKSSLVGGPGLTRR